MTNPTSAMNAPPTISGPAHGVELSVGQATLISVGAGAVPSEASTTEIPSGTFRVVVSDPCPVNSSSQRSDPAGLVGSVAGRAVAAAGAGVPVSLVTVNAAPSASSLTAAYSSSPIQARMSAVRP
jgi:hypothetical protein